MLPGISDATSHFREESHIHLKSINNPINRLVRLTIDVLEKDSRYRELFNSDDKLFCEAVQQIKQYIGTGDIANRGEIIKDNLRPVSHPLFQCYKTLQKLCLAILRHEKLTFGHDDNNVHGILFDGSWLWEEYLAKIMPSGIVHSDNRNRKNRLYALAEGTWEWYPDFYRKGDMVNASIVIDAKYKNLDCGVGASDQHQIVSYMYVLKAKMGGFVYPCARDCDNVKHDCLGDLNGFGGKIYKFGVPVSPNASGYSEFVERMGKVEEVFRRTINESI